MSEIEVRTKKQERKNVAAGLPRHGQKSTELYQRVSTMKEFNMQPASWVRLSNLDKKILLYHRIMEGHYIDKSTEAHEKKMEADHKHQEFINKLPKQMPRGR